jgi:ABC-2 type transport system permease protein
MRRVILAIAGKELREIWRDPISLVLALVLPLVLLFLFTYGLNFDVPQIRLGVADLDQSATSRDYLASLTASGDLRVVAEAQDVQELGAWLDRGSIDVGVVIPPIFERAILARQPAAVETLVDGSYPPRAKATLAMLDAGTAVYNHRLMQEEAGLALVAGPAVVPEARVWFNPALKSVNFIVPGLFSLILMTFAPLLSTLAIVRERERGSIQQILAAPVSPAAFILGKALPYGLLAFVDLLLVLVAGLFWFQVPFRGSLLLFLLAATIYVFGAVGIGLLVSTLTRSQVTAMLLAFAVTIMPTMLFSGFLLPVSSMPVNLQYMSLIFPARYFTEIARGIALKASGLDLLWPQLLALVVLTGAILTVATRRFHRRMG